MKKKISFNINFTKRALYTIIFSLVILLAGVAVFAFGTSTPSTFGHSAGELDLSEGVQGDAVFLGNLDVAGSIKVGTSAICDTNAEGSLKYNPISNVIEICNTTSWQELCGGTGGDELLIVNGNHTMAECSDAGGIPTDMGGEVYVCKFLSASCVTGWTQYLSWSKTSSNTCTSSASGNCISVSCTTGSHGFSNVGRELCLYERCYSSKGTCYAAMQQVGCY